MGTGVLEVMIDEYRAVGRVLCEQSRHMVHALHTQGRARLLRCTMGSMPQDVNSVVVVIAEPNRYSIWSYAPGNEVLLIAATVDPSGVDTVVDGSCKDLALP